MMMLHAPKVFIVQPSTGRNAASVVDEGKIRNGDGAERLQDTSPDEHYF